MTADPAALAASLSKPVANGLLPLNQALAAIAATTSKNMATLPGNGTLDERLHIYNHILALNIRNHMARREQTTGEIKRTIHPMIETGVPSNKLLAEAFNVNEDSNHPLSEAETKQIVVTEVYWSLQRKRNVSRR